jgi:hypothetical protein
MFRLIKLSAYALFGYVVYELIMGLKEGGRPQFQPGSRPHRKAARNPSARGQNISGPGRGESVSVADTSGAERTERVGRGAF